MGFVLSIEERDQIVFLRNMIGTIIGYDSDTNPREVNFARVVMLIDGRRLVSVHPYEAGELMGYFKSLRSIDG